MNTHEIEALFQEKVNAEVRLHPEGVNRYQIFTPFMFDDGDHLVTILKQRQGHWVLTDEGHTIMHLSYSIELEDLRRGTRQKIIENALSMFEVEDWDGELVLPVPGDQFGDALYSFVQALLKITDVSYLSRERVRNTFLEDVEHFMQKNVDSNRLSINWHDEQLDPEGKYQANYRINGMKRPLYIYGLLNDDHVRDATISLQKYESWEQRFSSLGIFYEQESINRKVLARYSDVCDKQFSSFYSNKDRIHDYIMAKM